MKMIVGLGNPGLQYINTRHNIGFMVLDRVADCWSEGFTNSKFKADIAEVRYKGEKVILVKPNTYMNLSGQAVVAIAHWYKIQPEEIIVVYDDMDLELGRLRFRQKGSSGGHNGIKSISACLGTENYPRLKLGIGRPKTGQEASTYVLGNFCGDQIPLVAGVLDLAKEGLEYFLQNDIVAAMNKFNVK